LEASVAGPPQAAQAVPEVPGGVAPAPADALGPDAPRAPVAMPEADNAGTPISLRFVVPGQPEPGGPAGGDEAEHEQYFYLSGRDYEQRQAAATSFDDFAFDFEPRPAPVPPMHRRRLRRVVGYVMGAAGLLFVVGVGRYLGRELLSSSTHDAAAATNVAPPPSAPPSAPAAPAAPPARTVFSNKPQPAPLHHAAPPRAAPAPSPARDSGRTKPRHLPEGRR
jgi:hypothetical protein